ncbi:MAG TPA: hypothetical protein VJS91_10795 [Nitrososphaeraceae archaeon]|nr:hypothetical protein [Nitrososphaeraceae archaeon]
MNFRIIEKGLVVFHRFVDPDPTINHKELIAECYPKSFPTGVEWDAGPIYVKLEDLEVCECNQTSLASMLPIMSPNHY